MVHLVKMGITVLIPHEYGTDWPKSIATQRFICDIEIIVTVHRR
jgi:hypothetical protein